MCCWYSWQCWSVSWKPHTDHLPAITPVQQNSAAYGYRHLCCLKLFTHTNLLIFIFSYFTYWLIWLRCDHMTKVVLPSQDSPHFLTFTDLWCWYTAPSIFYWWWCHIHNIYTRPINNTGDVTSVWRWPHILCDLHIFNGSAMHHCRKHLSH